MSHSRFLNVTTKVCELQSRECVHVGNYFSQVTGNKNLTNDLIDDLIFASAMCLRVQIGDKTTIILANDLARIEE